MICKLELNYNEKRYSNFKEKLRYLAHLIKTVHLVLFLFLLNFILRIVEYECISPPCDVRTVCTDKFITETPVTYIHSLTDAKYFIGSHCVIYQRVCAHFRSKQERSSFILKSTCRH